MLLSKRSQYPFPPPLAADLVQLLQGSQEPLVQALAGEMLRAQQDKKGSQTVGARFREQLRDLIQRLDA